MQLWRVKTTKAVDDAKYEGTFFDNHGIDTIVTSLDDALAEANGRLQAETNLEVTISKQEMTERYRAMYDGSEFVKDPKTGHISVKSNGKTIGK